MRSNWRSNRRYNWCSRGGVYGFANEAFTDPNGNNSITDAFINIGQFTATTAVAGIAIDSCAGIVANIVTTVGLYAGNTAVDAAQESPPTMPKISLPKIKLPNWGTPQEIPKDKEEFCRQNPTAPNCTEESDCD